MPTKKKSKKKWIVIGAIVAVLLILIIIIGNVLSSLAAAVSTATTMVEVEEITSRDMSETISLTGTAEGISKTNVTSKASAEVSTLSVSVGDQVNEGDILCTMDSSKIDEKIAVLTTSLSNETALNNISEQRTEDALTNAKDDRDTALASAQTQIDQAVADYNTANGQLGTDKATLATKQGQQATALSNMNNAKAASDAAPENQDLLAAYEAAKATYDGLTEEIAELNTTIAQETANVTTLSRAVDSANAAYSSTKTSADRAVSDAETAIKESSYKTEDTTTSDSLEDLQEQKEDCVVYAPISGVVTAVNISVGDTNTPNTAIITIEDTSSMKVTVSVDETKITSLEEGMEATVTSTALDGEEMTGEVTRVVRVKSANALDTATGSSGSYAAEITIPESNLLVGMSVKATVVIKDGGESLAVPYDLVQYDGDQAYILVADMDDSTGMATAVRKNITVGDEVNYYTAVTGGDVKDGDYIINDDTIAEGETFFASTEWDDQLEEE